MMRWVEWAFFAAFLRALGGRAPAVAAPTAPEPPAVSRGRRVNLQTYPPTHAKFRLVDTQWGALDWGAIDFWMMKRAGISPGPMVVYHVYENTAGTKTIYAAQF